MKITGSLLKMKSEISQPIKYYLPIGSESVEMNSLINKPVRFTFENQIFCTNCGLRLINHLIKVCAIHVFSPLH